MLLTTEGYRDKRIG